MNVDARIDHGGAFRVSDSCGGACACDGNFNRKKWKGGRSKATAYALLLLLLLLLWLPWRTPRQEVKKR